MNEQTHPIKNDSESDGPVCEMAITITDAPGAIPAGTKSVDITVRYTAQIKHPDGTVEALSKCVIYIIVEKIENRADGAYVIDQKMTHQPATSPTEGEEIAIVANSDMDLQFNDNVRINAMLVSNECPPASDGPRLIRVMQ